MALGIKKDIERKPKGENGKQVFGFAEIIGWLRDPNDCFALFNPQAIGCLERCQLKQTCRRVTNARLAQADREGRPVERADLVERLQLETHLKKEEEQMDTPQKTIGDPDSKSQELEAKSKDDDDDDDDDDEKDDKSSKKDKDDDDDDDEDEKDDKSEKRGRGRPSKSKDKDDDDDDDEDDDDKDEKDEPEKPGKPSSSDPAAALSQFADILHGLAQAFKMLAGQMKK